MDYTIKQSRLEKLIWGYLDKHYYPDYMWSVDEDFYRKEVDNFGYITFEVNDGVVYEYFDHSQFYNEKNLQVSSQLFDNLSGFFNDFWIPVFVKWFEHNTGLDVDSLRYQGEKLYTKQNES